MDFFDCSGVISDCGGGWYAPLLLNRRASDGWGISGRIRLTVTATDRLSDEPLSPTEQIIPSRAVTGFSLME